MQLGLISQGLSMGARHVWCRIHKRSYIVVLKSWVIPRLQLRLKPYSLAGLDISQNLSPNLEVTMHVSRMINCSYSWWRHQMEIFSALLALWAVTGEFPAHRPVTRSFHVFFDLRLNKRLSKQSWGWWFGTPSHSLWRHCNVMLWWSKYLLVLHCSMWLDINGLVAPRTMCQ